jgi:hypothetical protein
VAAPRTPDGVVWRSAATAVKKPLLHIAISRYVTSVCSFFGHRRSLTKL